MNSIVRVGDGDGFYGEQRNLSGDRRVSIVLGGLSPWPQAVLFNIQYWSVDGKYRIYLTRLRNGVKDELLASLSPRFAPSQINSIFTVNRPILYLSCSPRCPKKSF